MATEIKTKLDRWWILCMAVVDCTLAWVLAGWGWSYPPIPMFLTAILAGWLFRGRPQRAARAGLWCGFAWSWIAELAYFSVRLNETQGPWAKMPGLELLGLGIAEIFLYTALLSFFSAFVAWGSNPAKTVSPMADAAEPAEALRRPEVPFQPDEESGNSKTARLR